MKKSENSNVVNNEFTAVEVLTANTFAELMETATQDQYTNVSRDVTESGKSFVTKDYELINPIGKRTTLTIMNPDVIKSTEKIAFALTANRVMEFAICRELANINNDEMLSEMGFKSISEYGNSLFDFSRVTCTQYARIGKVFIDDEYKVKFRYIPRSYQKSHLLELLPLIGEGDDMSALEAAFVDSHLLHDGMSTAAVRKAVKGITSGVIDVEGREVPIDDSEPAESPTMREKGKPAKKTTPQSAENEYNVQVEIGKALNHLSALEEICKTMSSNGITIPLDTFNMITQLSDLMTYQLDKTLA